MAYEGGDPGGVGQAGDEHAVGAGLLVGVQAGQGVREVAVAQPVRVGAGVHEEVGGGGLHRGDLPRVQSGRPQAVLQVDAGRPDHGQLAGQLGHPLGVVAEAVRRVDGEEEGFRAQGQGELEGVFAGGR
ncbi:hypothetical protein GCM10022232_60640 [Streptomyces plumbiresistens]|uniref:Uncharacterized protein n=1 Tax=Streptomyces plumbiresistens TaxID=511811 RepID=A0ABP7SG55_9ACTN